jgi:hypothetical protein
MFVNNRELGKVIIIIIIIVIIIIIGFLVSWGGVSPQLDWSRTIVDECGRVGGTRIGMGNRNTLDKISAPVPLCSPQIPHNLT